MYWQSGGQPVNRREFITLTGASVAWPFAAMAQEPGRTYRLGVLFAGSRSGDVVSAFFDGVRSQGFIEGQNLTVIYHALGMNSDLLPEWVAELVKARVDVIAVAGNSAIRAAQGATKTIPILAITDDVVGTGLGRVDGFDQDEAESERDERAVILRRLLASKCDTLEAFELADSLFNACPCLVECFRKEGGHILGVGSIRDCRTYSALARGVAV